MEEELRDYQRAQEEALTKRQLLEQTLKDLEYELEAKSHLKDDRGRLVKQMEVCGQPGSGETCVGQKGSTAFLRTPQPLGKSLVFYSLAQLDVCKVISFFCCVGSSLWHVGFLAARGLFGSTWACGILVS